MRAVPDDDLGAVERPLYLCAAMTGLRQGELIGLRWCDIDWVAGRVRVAESYTRGAFDSPKSHRGRSVPMSDRLAGELERHFQRTRWRGERRPRLRPPAHRPRPRRLEAPQALPPRRRRARASQDLTFHELRHTFGTRMAAAGAPLRSIQAWMGHADASTTEIYSHYAPDPAGEAGFAERAFGTASAPASAEPTRLPGL